MTDIPPRQSPLTPTGIEADDIEADRSRLDDETAQDEIARAEGAPLRQPVEQSSTSAAPAITTDAEPIRPTPDDALHGYPPNLTHKPHADHRQAEDTLHWGAIAAIVVVIGLFLLALGTLITAG